MSDLGPGINPHIPMFLDPFKDVVLILFYFHVSFKVEPLTFSRVMCGDKEPFGLTRNDIYIIWSQEMVPQFMVFLPSVSRPLGWLYISPAAKISRYRRDHHPDFHHVCLEGYGPQTIFKNWCARNHLIFGWQEARLRFIQARGHRIFGSQHIRKWSPSTPIFPLRYSFKLSMVLANYWHQSPDIPKYPCVHFRSPWAHGKGARYPTLYRLLLPPLRSLFYA